MLTNQQQLDSGFSLIESLIAIMVLLLAFAGPLTIVGRGLNTSLLARENVTAFFLAQEGIELVLKLRDNKVLSGLDDSNTRVESTEFFWQWRPANCGGDPGTPADTPIPCGLDPVNTYATAVKCDSGNEVDCTIRKSSSLPYWRIDTSLSNLTKYTRIINIDMTSDSAHIISTVTWESFLGDKTFTAETYIYNVYGNLPNS